MPSDELLERGDQAAQIDEALASARRGDGRVLVIEGPPGIGKSRLLQELRDRAAGRQRVLFARASELERGFAFGVVRQLFEGIVHDAELGPIALAGAAASARDIFEDLPGEERAASFAVLHGLYWLTLNLAEIEPLVLAIDDLHWADASSLRFLSYVGRRLDGTPTLLAATTRPAPPATVDADLLAELLSEPSAQHVYPKALTQPAVDALLTDQLERPVDPVFAQACFEATDGNPLMLRQLARSLQAEGTEPTAANAAGVRRAAHRALSRTVLARVGRYSPAAIAVARAVAVLGDTATVPLIETLTTFEPREITKAWRELVEAEVLQRDELGFVHALVRDAIYFDLPEPERAILHLEAGRALSAAGASLERVASQLELATPNGDQWVAQVLVEAGTAALRRGAPDAAARHLRRALDEPIAEAPRPAVMGQLAEALFDVDAVSATEVLAELAELQPDRRGRAEVEIALVQALFLTDRWAEANLLSAEAIGRLTDEEDDLAAMFHAVQGAAVFFGLDDRGVTQHLEHSLELADGASLGHRLLSGLAAQWWAYIGGTAAECGDLAARALQADATILRDHTLVAVSPLYVLALADRDEGLDLWERARLEARRSGSLILHLTVDLWLGFLQQRRGDLTAAIAGLTDAISRANEWGSGGEPKRFAHSALALAYMDAGDLGRARATLDTTPASGAELRPSLGNALWWHAQAWVLFSEGRLEEALAATHTLEHVSSWMKHPIGVDWHLPRALTLHRLGDQAAAEATAEQACEISENWGAPGILGPALRIRSEIRGDEDLADLERAIALLEDSPARVQLARTLIAYGAALRRQRKPTEAREPLERAYELAGACGSPGLVELARTELAATGVRRRPGDAAGAGALTPSERRVADLAASGRTNREIAQELYVTPKTVEVHLSAVYRKLGIASRRALAGALAGAA